MSKTVLSIFLIWTLLSGCMTGIPFGMGDVLAPDTPYTPDVLPPAELTLISWNIKKNDENNSELAYLIRLYAPDLLCLQEVTGDTCLFMIDGYRECRFAPSWQSRDRNSVTGVFTLSRFELSSVQPVLSPGREFFVFTPKTSLITTMELQGGRSLMVINVHLLNFVPLRLIRHQLEELYLHAQDHDGPMIVCGDFNTWNSSRLEVVQRFAARLDLVQPLALSGRGGTASDWLFFLKPFLAINLDMPLDHIFCRGLEILAFERLTFFESSDHDPLLLKVRLLD